MSNPRSRPIGRTPLLGFTLIELVMVIAIIGILVTVALPSYRQYIIRGNRTAAQADMLDIANREQQYLLANRVYADKATLNFALSPEVSANYDYDIAIGVGTVPSYTIDFTAIDGQVSDGDLSLTSEGVKSPVDKW